MHPSCGSFLDPSTCGLIDTSYKMVYHWNLCMWSSSCVISYNVFNVVYHNVSRLFQCWLITMCPHWRWDATTANSSMSFHWTHQWLYYHTFFLFFYIYIILGDGKITVMLLMPQRLPIAVLKFMFQRNASLVFQIMRNRGTYLIYHELWTWKEKFQQNL